ncbi:cold shock protein 1 isoform X2 [Aristolochia californica]|uniref:cold shock protein 1 isoform X2 n=1 Tax=Aristolochia californica TaxID=171875 RepID=UPI0035DEF7FB
MVSQRQRLAQKRFKEVHPELFPKTEPTPPNPDKSKKKKFSKKGRFKPKKTGDGSIQKKKSNSLRKHPLRVPGMKPGESCFICKANDHIAKSCPNKSLWEKNKICLLCRHRGHSLKNCPNKGDDDDKKYCYNCGASGHSLSKCPQPLQDGGTKFASCFICNERGHLSKNCPKNTHGIYPKGGSCKICGGVTHLAKDCPNKGNKKPDAASGFYRNYEREGESRQPQHITFRSGDDFEDDFMVEDMKTVKKDGIFDTHAETDSANVQAGKSIIVKPKKKQGPKVVNFVG